MANMSRARTAVVSEILEARKLLTATVTATPPAITTDLSAGAQTVNLSNYFSDPAEASGSTTVFFNTSVGVVPVQLTDSATPITVANFLNYVNAGSYGGTIFHRSELETRDGIGIVQGGGYSFSSVQLENEGVTVPEYTHIATNAPITLEASDSRPNSLGTIAMARTSDANSATSEFFFNTSNNTQSLGTSNGGGYATFGTVEGNGLSVVQAINALGEPYHAYTSEGYSFGDQPYASGYTAGSLPTASQVVLLNSVTTGLSYSVSSDNTSVVQPSVTGDTLTLTPESGGTANITISAAGVDGTAVTSTFAVTIPSTTQTVTIGTKTAKSLVFTDADGTTSTITIAGGTAAVTVNGTAVSQATNAKTHVVTISGTGLSLADVNVSAGKTLTIKSVGGNGGVGLGTLEASHGLATLTGTGVTLTGAANIAGVAKSITLASLASGSTLTAGTISTLKIAGSDAGTVTAGAIKTLTAGSIAGGTVSATGGGTAISKLTAGSITAGSVVRAIGNIGTLTAAGGITDSSILAGVQSTFAPGGTLPTGDQLTGGEILNLKVTSAVTGSLIASGTLGTVQIGNLPDTANATNAGYASGIVTHGIKSYKGAIASHPVKLAKITDEATLAADLSAAGVTGLANIDFEIV